MGKQWKQCQTLFLVSADGDCSHEIERRWLLGRKVMANLDSIFKSRNITLPTKIPLVKAMIFPVVMYECESWTVKRAERGRIDAFELRCWRRLLRVPWTAKRSNQSIQITVEAQSVDFLLDTGATYSMLTEAPGPLSPWSTTVTGLSGRAKHYYFSCPLSCNWNSAISTQIFDCARVSLTPLEKDILSKIHASVFMNMEPSLSH